MYMYHPVLMSLVPRPICVLLVTREMFTVRQQSTIITDALEVLISASSNIVVHTQQSTTTSRYNRCIISAYNHLLVRLVIPLYTLNKALLHQLQ